jgi:DNA polymerase III epsilon subunit-like protein
MKAASSNWGSLQSKLSKESKPTAARSSSSNSAPAIPREKRTDLNEACKGIVIPLGRKETENKDDKKMAGENLSTKIKDKYVGLDCEMVGIGLSGKQSALARCCMVDFDGSVIYDKYVRPKGFVTDFRTQWSGIRKQDLRAGEAITLLECQENVTALLKDKILVGHALKNDLDVLMLGHPKKMIRDTATFKPYMRVGTAFFMFDINYSIELNLNDFADFSMSPVTVLQ